MRRILMRRIAVGAAIAVVAGAVGGAALAAQGHGRFAGVQGMRAGGFGQPAGLLGRGMGMGFGRGDGYGFGGHPGGPGFDRGGGNIFGMDVLTPAAKALGIDVSTLESDLAGGKTLAQEATDHTMTSADLVNAIVAAEKTILDGYKAAGWLTANQETALVTQLTNQITNLVNNGPPVPPSGAKAGGLLQAASTYLGISVSDLQTALSSGKTLADEVAAAGNNRTVGGLVSALEAPMKTKLDAAVTAGTITSAQETTVLNNLTTRLTNLVNGKSGSTAQNSLRKFGVMKPAALMRTFFH